MGDFVFEFWAGFAAALIAYELWGWLSAKGKAKWAGYKAEFKEIEEEEARRLIVE